VDVLVPYHRGDLISKLHESDSEIVSLEHEEHGTRVVAKVREGLAAELEPFIHNA
jgi:GTP-binding protein HflX